MQLIFSFSWAVPICPSCSQWSLALDCAVYGALSLWDTKIKHLFVAYMLSNMSVKIIKMGSCESKPKVCHCRVHVMRWQVMNSQQSWVTASFMRVWDMLLLLEHCAFSRLKERFVRNSCTLSQCLTAWRYASMVLDVIVCLSVCLSVTCWYCTKTAKHRIMQTTPRDSPGTLVFWRQQSLVDEPLTR